MQGNDVRLVFRCSLSGIAGHACGAADSGSGTIVITEKGGKSVTHTFKHVYAVRAEHNKEPVTVVALTEPPMDKKAITAALKKERIWSVISGSYDHLFKRPFAMLEIYQDESRNLFVTPGLSTNEGKSDIKVNTAKRVEGRYSYDGTRFNQVIKIDLRFATDLADVGPGAPIKLRSE